MEVASLFFSTVLLRPYVFAFLFIYLVAASLKIGLKKTAIFTLVAWSFAYASEFSSIRNGFPFGLYYYIPSTVGRELWIFGVPFMDSLSFTFLAYASWATARVFVSPSEGAGTGFRIKEGAKDPFSWDTVLLGSILFMLIDVVIDPLALRGDRWFLGKIYYYPKPGPYFGVTLENFLGWFFVGFVTLSLWGAINRRMGRGLRNGGRAFVDLLGPALYYIVLLFNISMTFDIGEHNLAWSGVFIFLPVTALLAARLLRQVPRLRSVRQD